MTDSRVSVAQEALERLLEQNERSHRTKNRLLGAIGVAVIVLLVGVGAITVEDQASLDGQLLRSGQMRSQLLVQVDECLYNHEDRLAARATGAPMPAQLPKCPPDGLVAKGGRP